MSSGEHKDVRFYTDNIRTFAAVAKVGGVGRAARSLGLSQPSVSQQISRLEALVGRRLFQRGKAGVSLTSEGEILFRHAQAMINISETIGRNFGLEGRKFKVSIGISEMLSLTSLHRALWLVAKQNPDISLKIVVGHMDTLRKGFENGDFDIVVSGPLAAPPLACFLKSEPLIWMGRADAPAPIRDPIPLVLPPDPGRLRDAMIASLELEGRAWSASFEVSNVAIAEAAIDAGFGYCAALRSMPLRTVTQLDARHGLPDLPSMDYYLNTSESAKGDEIVSEIGKIIRDITIAP